MTARAQRDKRRSALRGKVNGGWRVGVPRLQWNLTGGLLALVLPVAVLAQVGAAASPPATAPSKALPIDLTDLNRVDVGKLRFGSTCAAYCHGSEGRGGRAPSFVGRTDFDPHDAYRVIKDGRRGAGGVMPPFGQAFSDEQIWELVAYLQHLASKPANL